jgi:hypothetical protein
MSGSAVIKRCIVSILPPDPPSVQERKGASNPILQINTQKSDPGFLFRRKNPVQIIPKEKSGADYSEGKTRCRLFRR